MQYLHVPMPHKPCFMRLSLLVLISAGFMILSASAGPCILEVYPDTWIAGDEDEYLTITWDGQSDPLSITDGEGIITLAGPPATGSDTCTIARNGDAYQQVWGRYPDYEIMDKTPAVPQVTEQGSFQLSNRKDELTVSGQGRVYDTVSWPGTFTTRKGQIHVREADGSWDRRVLMAGGSRLNPVHITNVSGQVFVSPDCSRQVLENAIRSAKEKILLNVYEFTDPGLAELLCDAERRGVEVTVLLEGGPVGGIPAEEFPVIHTLLQAGTVVRLMEGEREDHAPYRYDHAKYLVSDGKQVFLTTENFKEHSFPHPGYAGNRGWGVFLDSPDLAQVFSRVFEDDANGPGVQAATGRPGQTEEPVQDTYRPVFSPVTFSDAEVTPVFSPDTSYLIPDMINRSRSRVWIQQAYITEYPGNKTNPFLSATIDAARRGVDVRILLDGYYYNIEGEDDNDEMVTRLLTQAARENISMKARVMYPEKSGLLKVHTKGVITDDEVLVSSMNWNENSASFNREAGVIIRDTGAASYFASVFLVDWSGAGGRGSASAVPDDDLSGLIQMTALAGVLVLLILVYRRYHR